MQFTAVDSTRGTFSYTNNGVSVAKFIERLTLINIPLAGSYVGAERYTLNGAGCSGRGRSSTSTSTSSPSRCSRPPAPTATITIEIDDSDGARSARSGAWPCSAAGCSRPRTRPPIARTTARRSPTRLYDLRVASNGGLEFRWTSRLQRHLHAGRAGQRGPAVTLRRTHSNRPTAAAAATFSDSAAARASVSSRPSSASLAQRVRQARAFVADRERDARAERGASNSDVPPVATVATTLTPSRRSPRADAGEIRPSSWMASWKCAPCPARSTFGDHANAQSFDRNASATPNGRRRTQHRTEVARILDRLEQHAEVDRRGAGARRAAPGRPRRCRCRAGSVPSSSNSARGTINARAGGTRATSAAMPGRDSASSLADDRVPANADAIEEDADEVLAFEHAAAGLAPLARRPDQARELAVARILARDDRGHRGAAPRCRQRDGAAGFGAAGRLQLEEHLVLRTMPSSARARSSIASLPVFRSRTSASSASFRALSLSLASRCAATCRSSSRTGEPAALAEPHRVLQRDDRGDEDQGEPAHRGIARMPRVLASEGPPRARRPPWGGTARSAFGGRSRQVEERVAARIARRVAQVLLDAQELVVLGDAVRARQRAGLDLAGVGADRDVGDDRCPRSRPSGARRSAV